MREDYLKGQRFNDDQVNIVVLQGTAGTTAMFGRTQGFEEIAAKHENWNILEQTNADFRFFTWSGNFFSQFL